MTLGVAMESEIRQQPSVLAENGPKYFQQLEAFFREREEFDMVLLAARGSSDNAALYARYLIEIHLGIPVSLAAPSVITRYKSNIRYRKALAIGISQSGAAPDVAEVLGYMKEQGHTTLAITNTPNSRLTTVATESLLLGCGPENSVAATKTYTSTLLALYQLVRALGGKLPSPQIPDDAWIERSSEIAQAFSGPMNRCNPIFAIARGYGFCTALETALKLMECALVPCKAYSAADFEHGPKALAGHGSAAISYFGSLPGLRDQGCEILEVDSPLPKSSDTEPIFPIWDIIVGQWLALHVARSRGLDPDKARHLSKVTETL
ncbi:MAG: SIS domain-containing protein [Armatimonadetes bacterium]|nr:SIS domain-containing protein [Armatimonadota bacterium]MBS1725439.1 SIS domain-containing protein [Armatimonadota bacterium]